MTKKSGEGEEGDRQEDQMEDQAGEELEDELEGKDDAKETVTLGRYYRVQC